MPTRKAHKNPPTKKEFGSGRKIFFLKLQIGAIIMDAGDGGKCGSGSFSFFRPFRPALNAHLCRSRRHPSPSIRYPTPNLHMTPPNTKNERGKYLGTPASKKNFRGLGDTESIAHTNTTLLLDRTRKKMPRRFFCVPPFPQQRQPPSLLCLFAFSQFGVVG